MGGPLGKPRMPQYNLKLGTEADLLEVIDRVEEAFREAPYNLPFSSERTEQVLRDVLKNGVIICLLNEHTQIVGVFIALRTILATSLEPVASELLWYVHPAYRKSRGALELLAAFEYWATEVAKVGTLILGNMQNNFSEKTHRLYLRKGYQLAEQTYVKKVNN